MDNIIELKQNEVAVVTGGCDLFGIGEMTGAFFGISLTASVLLYSTPTNSSIHYNSPQNPLLTDIFLIGAVFYGSIGFTIGRLVDIFILGRYSDKQLS